MTVTSFWSSVDGQSRGPPPVGLPNVVVTLQLPLYFQLLPKRVLLRPRPNRVPVLDSRLVRSLIGSGINLSRPRDLLFLVEQHLFPLREPKIDHNDAIGRRQKDALRAGALQISGGLDRKLALLASEGVSNPNWKSA